MEDRRCTSADEIDKDEWELFTTIATGRTYALRKVTIPQLALSGVLTIPQAEAETISAKAGEPAKLDEYELAQLELFMNALLCLGIASLKVVDKPRGECPTGTTSIESLAADRDELVVALLKKAGLGKSAIEAQQSVVSPARDGESFRDSESAAGGSGSPEAESVAS